MKKCFIDISRYFFLILFLGFFGSNTFFDHTHIYNGDIIVHSHPFKPDLDGKPIHNHNQSGYMLVFQLNSLMVNVTVSLSLAYIIFFLSGEVIVRAVNNISLKVCPSPSLLRGPPSIKVI